VLAARKGDTALEALDRRLQHHRYWSPSDWRSALAAVGLRMDRAERYFPRDAVRAWERTSNLTGGLAFELFGRRSETRGLQRRLKLDVLDALVPSRARARALEWLLARDLQGAAEVSDEPSGGLLVVATRTARGGPS
jgi:hypothetical protein